MRTEKRISILLAASLLLSAVLPLAAAAAPAETALPGETAAETAPETEVVTLATVEDYLEFAASCTLDTWSMGKTFVLEADLDLTGRECGAVPVFFGVFDGNGHEITGFSLSGAGSRQGLFRTVESGAVVRNLRVSGTVTPEGPGQQVGGIAGENRGTIQNCQFEGTVSGTEQVGGIAGLCADTGLIVGCRFSGEISGEHRVGGIAGSAEGILLDCENTGKVNTTAVEPKAKDSPDFSSFDISSLSLSEEDIVDLTDIGGIAGYASGTVEQCRNTGEVGYAHMGYNVGGIVGRQSGYVTGCENDGEVRGRKDVGGIAGQLEPYAVWDFSESKLEDLKGELDSLQKTVQEISGRAGSRTAEIGARMQALSRSADQAVSALDGILQETKLGVSSASGALQEALEYLKQQTGQAGNLPTLEECRERLEAILGKDPDHECPLSGGLSELLKNWRESMGEITSVRDLFQKLEDLKQQHRDHACQIRDELDAWIEELRQSLEKNSPSAWADELEAILSRVEWTSPDTSALTGALNDLYQSASALGGELEGTVSGLSSDLNGICSRISDLFDTFLKTAEDVSQVETDPQEDISVREAYDHNDGAVDACKNSGGAAGDTNVGGIVGSVGFEVAFDREDELKTSEYLFSDARYLIFAVVRDCESAGDITAKKSAAGGLIGSMSYGAAVAGEASGAIAVEQGDYAGGIAGKAGGSIVNCASRVQLRAGKYVGGIVGSGTDISGCLSYSQIREGTEYLGSVAGATDGTVENNWFVENEIGGIDGVSYAGKAEPISYEEMTARAEVPDSFRRICVTFRTEEEIVEVAEVPYGGSLDTLPEVPDRDGEYWKWDDFPNTGITHSLTVTGSYRKLRNTIACGAEPAEYLAEGAFYEDQALTWAAYEGEMPEAEGAAVRSGTLSVNDYDGELRIRMREEAGGTLFARKGDAWEEISYETDGSYLVFSLENGGSFAYREAEKKNGISAWIWAGAAAAAAAGVRIVCRRKGKRKK